MILTGTGMAGSANRLAWVIGASPNSAASTNKVAWSTNGTNWIKGTITNNSSMTNVNSIAYNGTIWVAVGQGTNRLMTSTDGKTWTTANDLNTSFTIARTVAWNGTYFVAGGISINTTGSFSAFSSDGISWTRSAQSMLGGLSTTVADLFWTGSFWYASGRFGDSLGTTFSFAYTNNPTGATGWIGVSLPANLITGQGLGSVSDGTTTLLSGLKRPIDPSPPDFGFGRSVVNPATTFTLLTNFIDGTAKPILSDYNGGIFLAGGIPSPGNSSVQYSSDGVTWFNSVNSNTIFGTGSTNVSKFGWNGFLFVAGGFGTNKLGYSYDGDTWFAATSPLSTIGISSVASTTAPSLYPPL